MNSGSAGTVFLGEILFPMVVPDCWHRCSVVHVPVGDGGPSAKKAKALVIGTAYSSFSLNVLSTPSCPYFSLSEVAKFFGISLCTSSHGKWITVALVLLTPSVRSNESTLGITSSIEDLYGGVVVYQWIQKSNLKPAAMISSCKPPGTW